MIIAPRVVNPEYCKDDIGIRFPSFPSKKPKEPKPTLEEKKEVALVQSEIGKADHIAQLDVPLRNVEKIINTFFKYIIADVMTYFDQIRDLFIGFSGLLGYRFYSQTRKDLDGRRERALNEAEARQKAGQGTWVTETLSIVRKSDNANLFHYIKFAKKHPAINEEPIDSIPPVAGEQDDAEQGELPVDVAALDASKQALLATRPIDETTAKTDAHLNTAAKEVDGETLALLKNISEHQMEMEARFKAEEDEEKRLAEEEFYNSPEEVERRKREELSKYSAIQLRQPKGTSGIINWSKKITSQTLTKTLNLLPDSAKFVGWMEKIPLTAMFDPTMLRGKIDELVMHRIGFHKGSAIYEGVNTFLDKIWFILSPLIGYANALMEFILKAFDFLQYKIAFPVMSTYAVTANKVYVVFWGFHALLVEVVVSLSLWFVVFTWWWFRRVVMPLYRFIINLVLSRFGISV